MSGRSAIRSWTIASWRIGTFAGDRRRVIDLLEPLDADAIALQSVRAQDAREVAVALDALHVWARSHYPALRLVPGSAVGLAMLTAHRITASAEVVTSERRSLWSSERRIAQTVTVMRSDHSSYAITHRSSTDPITTLVPPGDGAPLVSIRPVLPTSGGHPEIELPDGATALSTDVTRPIAGAPPLVVTRFEMIWVEGDFAAS